jgi:hypothetical protein
LRSEGSWFRSAQANRSQDPISKTTRAKWTGDVAQAVEHLLHKPEALHSNHNTTKKRKKENKE